MKNKLKFFKLKKTKLIYDKKKHYKPYIAKQAIDCGTQGRKNKGLKRPVSLTGINKVPILDKTI